jgi:hypothetical protein
LKAEGAGMAKKTDFETPSILKRLFLFFPAFYIAFFLVSIIVLAGAQQPITGVSVFFTPFNWMSFSPAGTAAQLGTRASCRAGAARRGARPCRACARHPHLGASLTRPAPRRAPRPPTVPWVTLLITFLFFGPLLIFVIVQNTKQVWDFAATLTFFHWVITCLVTLSFPVNYIWWVTLLPCGLLMSTGGELSCYYLRDMREIQLDK